MKLSSLIKSERSANREDQIFIQVREWYGKNEIRNRSGGAAFGLYVTAAAAAWCKELARKLF